LTKINKRQDDLIRYTRHFEEEQLNPMIRATNSIAARFDGIVKALETLIILKIEQNQEKFNAVLQKISDKLNEHANVINNQGKQIGSLNQLMKQDNKKLLELIALYAELAACGVMDGKRKDNLKAEIYKLVCVNT
jgi:ABC-type transporter Mla subunit MlaD